MFNRAGNITEQPPFATVAVLSICVIVALAGAIITIVNPSALSFNEYLDALSKAAIGAGALGIGRGILGAGQANGGSSRNFDTDGDEGEFPGGSIPPDPVKRPAKRR